MKQFLQSFGNKKRFNEEVIRTLKDKDVIYEYLENICKALESIPYVTYLSMEIEEDENKFIQRKLISVKDTRLSLVKFKFRVEFGGEVEEPEIVLFVPKRINNNYFLLGGNKYYAPYQIIDSSTYNTKNSVILKSILMATVLRQDKKKCKDIEGNEYRENIFFLNLFSKKINLLNYFFPVFGYKQSLEFLGVKDKIEIVQESDQEDKYVYFNLKTRYLAVEKEAFENDKHVRRIAITLLDCLVERGKTFDEEILEDLTHWKIKLGSLYTKNQNNQEEKADSVLLSFKRILDDTTKKSLKIPEEDKESMFHLTRWMVVNYDALKKKNNLSLLNKRFRYYEYIITPFLRKMSSNTYRILNSKNLTMNKLLTLFKVSSMIIIKSMQTSDLIRYNNAVNDMDLFNVSLKWSMRGMQALSSSNTVSMYYRDLNPSYVGRLGLNHSSNSDPGMSGTFSPFISTDGFYFNHNNELDPETLDD